ncbi:hypothetical protein J3A83DRAFT_4086330 [Scleroderma citrinum]
MENPRTAIESDARRNLYVLGLPFDLTKTEFSRIFAPFGTVTHAVILATVDNASRRRGFIVMSTHDEARAAINGLSRRQIKGHILDVSWAVVQRSQGFLDGGDRSAALAVTTPPSATCLDTKFSEAPLNSCWTITLNPATNLLASNLPTLLFAQVSDLQPLFRPFGPIKKISILQASHNTLDSSITAVVEYVDISSAQEARDSLHFQTYAGHLIDVHYVCDNLPPTDVLDTPVLRYSSTSGQAVERCFNPLAIHFNIDCRRSLERLVQSFQLGSQYHTVSSDGLAISPQITPICRRPVAINEMPRSNSLTGSKLVASSSAVSSNNSSIWRQAGRLYGGSYPTFNHANTISPLVTLPYVYNVPISR